MLLSLILEFENAFTFGSMRVSLFTGLDYWTGILEWHLSLSYAVLESQRASKSLYCMHGDGYSDSVLRSVTGC